MRRWIGVAIGVGQRPEATTNEAIVCTRSAVFSLESSTPLGLSRHAWVI